MVWYFSFPYRALRGPVGSPRKSKVGTTGRLPRRLSAGLASGSGLAWLARLVPGWLFLGFPVDFGLISTLFRLDFGFHLDLGWISIGFGFHSLGF